MTHARSRERSSSWSEVGRTWSRYGRQVGMVALERVAEALKRTAAALEAPEAPPAERRPGGTAPGKPSEPTAAGQ